MFDVVVALKLCLFILQPTLPADGRPPPRIGNIGHLTRISNKLVQLGNNNGDILACLQVYTILLHIHFMQAEQICDLSVS